jgi:hypothetical protein
MRTPTAAPPVTTMTLESNQVLDGGAMLLRYRIQNE